MLTWTEEPSDPQYEISLEVYERLKSITDGEIEIQKIHKPNLFRITEEESEGIDIVAGPISRQSGDRIAGSSVNYLIANGGIVMPAFGDNYDQMALEKNAGTYPRPPDTRSDGAGNSPRRV